MNTSIVLNSVNVLELVGLYQTVFNKLPDAEGLQYWAGRMDQGMTLPQVAQSFLDNPVWVAAHPTPATQPTMLTDILAQQNAFTNEFLGNAFHGTITVNPQFVDHWTIMYLDTVPKAEAAASIAIQLVGVPHKFASWEIHI
jgi:hypothetical protein